MEDSQALTTQVDKNPSFLATATQLNSEFAEECNDFFGSGGTLQDMYGLVLLFKARSIYLLNTI